MQFYVGIMSVFNVPDTPDQIILQKVSVLPHADQH